MFMNIKVYPILIGQVLAILYTTNGIFSTLLIMQGVDLPIFQLFLLYSILCISYALVLAVNPRNLNMKLWYKYALVSIVDTQANYLTYLSFQLTSMVSVCTLSNSSVIIVMILSILFLKRRFNPFQYVGFATCVIGLVLILLSHLQAAGWAWTGNVLGDFVVLGGAALFAVSNILQEYFMCEGADPSEYLFILGGCGSIVIGIMGYLLEFDRVKEMDNWKEGLFMLSFGVSIVISYSMAPSFLKRYGATFYNLSLLVSSLYSLFFELFYLETQLEVLYLIGFCLVLIGIVIYNIPYKEEEKKIYSELTNIEEDTTAKIE
jgi:drug/metabolite transporter (DMT)-like permease